MIKNIYIINDKEETLTINIYNHKNSGFNIRKIDGLGPVKANIITTPIVTNDGDIFNSARADKRNIVLTLGFEITPEIGLNTIEDVRQKTYNFFTLKSMVRITIETDNRKLYTYGYVESNEPDIFNKDETCIISLICPDSYFTSENERNVRLDQLKATFKFPFEVIIKDLPDQNRLTDTLYELTKDTKFNSTKEYYERSGEEGSYTYDLTSDTFFLEGKDYYEKILMPITNVLEDGDDMFHNGNIVYGLYEYSNIYADLDMRYTYDDITNNFMNYKEIYNRLK